MSNLGAWGMRTKLFLRHWRLLGLPELTIMRSTDFVDFGAFQELSLTCPVSWGTKG